MNKFLMFLAIVGILVLVTLAKAPSAGGFLEDRGVVLIDPPDLCGGYPIQLKHSGSYKLLHNINLAKINCDRTAIEVNADNITIDLNGFSIVGRCELYTCTTDGHHGIDATDHGTLPAGHNGTTVKNGTVAFMADDGVHLGNDGIIENVRAISNKGEGIQCGEGCLVTNTLANGNGGTGFEVDDDALVSNVVGQGNSEYGIHCDSNTRVSVRGSVFTANTLGGINNCNNTGGNIP